MWILSVIALTVALSVSPAAARAGFVDPLHAPAEQSALAADSPMQGVTLAGKRLVAIGRRGHIVFSDDGGSRWRQAEVPVAVDLTAVHFPTAEKGWAVGHSGVVLHSSDGGRRWIKQLDGAQAAAIALAFYQRRADGGDAHALRLVPEVQRLVAEGADKPFLDVWFESERAGYIVGAFNLIFKTDDAGKTWEPWLHRVDNPKGYHLYGIRGTAAGMYIAGEQGLVLHLDAATQRITSVATPYQGSYFGLLFKPDLLLVYGLRGNAYRSRDGGRNWTKCDTGVSSGITGSTVLSDGRLVLVTQTGHVLVSRDDGASFAPVAIERPLPFHGVTQVSADAIALAGLHGVRVERIQ